MYLKSKLFLSSIIFTRILMKKLLPIIIFSLLLNSCGKSDKDYLEKCADQRTYSYWKERTNEFIKEKEFWLAKLSLTDTLSDSYKMASIMKVIEEKEYYIELYANASKKSLDEKLYELTLFEKNFIKCEQEFSKNPIYFKEVYK